MWLYKQSTRLGLCQSSWGWTLDLIVLRKLSFTMGFHEILVRFCWDFMGFHGISWDFMASQCFSFLHSVPLGLIWWSAPWVLSHLSHTRPAGPGAGSISSLAFRRLTLNIAGFHSSPDTLLRDLGPAARIMVFEIQRNLGVQLGLWVYKKPQEVGIF